MPNLLKTRHWKTQYRALLVAEGLAMAAFGTSMPIIPLYIQDLGVSDPIQITWWAGLIGSTAAVALALFAPIWGLFSDRYGKRLMLIRAMAAGCVVVGLMCLVTNPWQLLFLRTLQGALTGTVAAATVLMAALVPMESAGMALGMLTTAVFVGNSAGPMLGGLVADLFGRRMTFLATAVLLALALAIILKWVVEPARPVAATGRPAGSAAATAKAPRQRFFNFSPLREQPVLWGLLFICLAVQGASSIIYPMLPLFVQSLGTAGSLVASTTGLIIGVSALSAAVAALFSGRLGQRFGYGAVLQVCLVGGFAFCLPQAWVTQPWQLLVLRTLAGVFLGGAMPAVNSLIATRVNREHQGGVFGLSSTFSSGGAALGPAVGSAVAAIWGLGAVFVAASCTLGLTGLAMVAGLRHPWRGPARHAAPAPDPEPRLPPPLPQVVPDEDLD